MSLEAPSHDVEVRLEEDEEVLGGGDGAGRPGTAAVATQAGGRGSGAIEEGHVVETTALAALHLEVGKDQGDRATSCPDAPAALGIIGIALGVPRAGDLPGQPRQLPATGI